MLRVDAAVVGRGAGDLQVIARQGDDRGAAAGHGHRLGKVEILALGVLLHRLALEDHRDKRPRRTVENRWLAGVHLDDEIVDPAAMDCGQDVLDRVNLRGSIGDRRAAHEVDDLVDGGPHFGVSMDVGATEDDAEIHRRRLQCHPDRVTCVERVALDADFTQQGPLLHGESEAC
jgi:hypothetical protein